MILVMFYNAVTSEVQIKKYSSVGKLKIGLRASVKARKQIHEANQLQCKCQCMNGLEKCQPRADTEPFSDVD